MNKSSIDTIARKLSIDPRHLDALINFETGGTYNPLIKNPYSSARGLIQITDAAARDIGFSDSLDAVTRNPDFDSQMNNVVYPYLKRYAPYPTLQSLYMAVFYPAARTVPPDTIFPESVRKVNPGIITVQDYVNFVNKRVSLSGVQVAATGAAFLVVGVLVWFYLKK